MEISRQIAARTPLPKFKPVDHVKVAAAQLGPDGAADVDVEEDDPGAATKIDRSA